MANAEVCAVAHRRFFISPGICVLTDLEQTPTQEVLSSSALRCLHLPSQVLDHVIYTRDHLHFLSTLPQTLGAAENLPNWTLCSAPCHHMTDSDSESREHHKAALLLRSAHKAQLCTCAACCTATFH